MAAPSLPAPKDKVKDLQAFQIQVVCVCVCMCVCVCVCVCERERDLPQKSTLLSKARVSAALTWG